MKSRRRRPLTLWLISQRARRGGGGVLGIGGHGGAWGGIEEVPWFQSSGERIIRPASPPGKSAPISRILWDPLAITNKVLRRRLSNPFEEEKLLGVD